MLADVLAQPQQLTDALWRVDAARLEPVEAGGLVICGMGGSAIGGDLAAAAIGARATRPIRTVRDYALDPWTSTDTLVLCASYSGETEETLACYAAAKNLGAPRVALTTGGTLAAQARADGVPVIGVPSGLQPRAAVAYMVVGALECAAACAVAPSLRLEIERAGPPLERLTKEWGPEASDDAPAKVLARALAGTIPVIYGAGPTAPVALRWKTQVNENAKSPAFWATLPEANHNEICAWNPGGAERLAAVLLSDPDLSPRMLRRVSLTGEVAALGSAARIEFLTGHGKTRLERILSLVLLGDLVSLYMAVLAGIDPTPVEPIERFKQALAE